MSKNKNQKSIEPINLELNNNEQDGGGFNELEEYIQQNTSLKNKDDIILKSLLDGCYINVALQTKGSSYIFVSPKKIVASINRYNIKHIWKICIHMNYLFQTWE